LYEYECRKCHRVTEKIERVNGPHLSKCPYCGGKVEQKVSRSAIQFKGSGWYITDYAGKKAAADATGDNAGNSDKSDKSESKDSSTKDSSTKETKESKDTKTAASTGKKTEKKKS
jgi:putative FmdB family regulatory protein